MTLWDLIRAALRRWPVLLAGAVATLGLVYTHHAGRRRVLEPYPGGLPRAGEQGLPERAAHHVRGPDHHGRRGRQGSRRARQGHQVRVARRDAGRARGCATAGRSACPTRAASGPPTSPSRCCTSRSSRATAEEVEARQDEIVAQIADELDRLQRDAGVAPVNDITVTVAPESTGGAPGGGLRAPGRRDGGPARRQRHVRRRGADSRRVLRRLGTAPPRPALTAAPGRAAPGRRRPRHGPRPPRCGPPISCAGAQDRPTTLAAALAAYVAPSGRSTAAASSAAIPAAVGSAHPTYGLGRSARASGESLTTGTTPAASISSATSEMLVKDIASPATTRPYSSLSSAGVRRPWYVTGNGRSAGREP